MLLNHVVIETIFSVLFQMLSHVADILTVGDFHQGAMHQYACMCVRVCESVCVSERNCE